MNWLKALWAKSHDTKVPDLVLTDLAPDQPNHHLMESDPAYVARLALPPAHAMENYTSPMRVAERARQDQERFSQALRIDQLFGQVLATEGRLRERLGPSVVVKGVQLLADDLLSLGGGAFNRWGPFALSVGDERAVLYREREPHKFEFIPWQREPF